MSNKRWKTAVCCEESNIYYENISTKKVSMQDGTENHMLRYYKQEHSHVLISAPCTLVFCLLLFGKSGKKIY